MEQPGKEWRSCGCFKEDYSGLKLGRLENCCLLMEEFPFTVNQALEGNPGRYSLVIPILATSLMITKSAIVFLWLFFPFYYAILTHEPYILTVCTLDLHHHRKLQKDNKLFMCFCALLFVRTFLSTNYIDICMMNDG